jgi:DNA-directed RNA polymerase subunit L
LYDKNVHHARYSIDNNAQATATLKARMVRAPKRAIINAMQRHTAQRELEDFTANFLNFTGLLSQKHASN